MLKNPIEDQNLVQKISADKDAYFYLINKEIGFTSFYIIKQMRKVLGIKKIGFSGTLDPMATGLIIVATNSGTKFLDTFHFLDKIYEAEIELGKISDTFDMEGIIESTKNKKIPKLNEVKELIEKKFTGEILQTPPIFSAKKINGKKAYELARAGKETNIKPQKILIKNIAILEYSYPFLKLKITCSKGTYIRSIANDIGKELQTGAMLTKLERTQIGPFETKMAICQKDINFEILKMSKIDIKSIMKTLCTTK